MPVLTEDRTLSIEILSDVSELLKARDFHLDLAGIPHPTLFFNWLRNEFTLTPVFGETIYLGDYDMIDLWQGNSTTPSLDKVCDLILDNLKSVAMLHMGHDKSLLQGPLSLLAYSGAFLPDDLDKFAVEELAEVHRLAYVARVLGPELTNAMDSEIRNQGGITISSITLPQDLYEFKAMDDFDFWLEIRLSHHPHAELINLVTRAVLTGHVVDDIHLSENTLALIDERYSWSEKNRAV